MFNDNPWYEQLVVCIVTVLFVIVALVVFPIVIYWVWKVCITYREKVSKYNRWLMIITWSSIVLFTAVVILNAIFAVYVFITTNGDYSKFNSHYELTSLPITTSIGIYVTSKYFVYIALYLRLETLLRGTIFEYTQSKYTTLKILMFVSCLAIVAALVSIQYIYNLGFLFGGLYMILDIFIPVYINILFVSKIREIRVFIATQVEDDGNTNPKRATSLSITSQAEHDHETKKQDNKDGNNHKQNAVLYKLMIRCTFIALLVVVSSFLVLFYMTIRSGITLIVGKDLMVTLPIQILVTGIDSVINLMCVVSYFAFTKTLSDFLIDKIFCCCKGLSTRVTQRFIQT